MADASCSGPSPFKRLVDHQSRDGSQHQDRIRETAHTQTSFRSQPQGQSQNGFGAFVESNTQMPGPHDPAGRLAAHAAALESAHASPQQFHQFQPHARESPTADIANWAADFNRFNTQVSTQRPAQNGMAQNGMAHQQPPAQVDFAAAFAQPQRFMPGFSLQNGPMMHQQPVAQDGFDAEMSKWMAANGGGGNMEQVDAAMEQMAKELELNDSLLAQEEEAAATETTGATGDRTVHFTDLETPEIGNLSLENQRTQTPYAEEPTAEASKGKSAVSEAAERLLESVQHEDGEKWKNSVFLSLMRDFRDGKKDIVGDEILGNDIAQPDDTPTE